MLPDHPLSGKRLILGVTAGIAAYKAAVLLREFQKCGAEVRCVATPSAFRFLGKDTLSALSRQPVPSEVFPDDADISESWSRHIHWAEWADYVVIAPCTANTLAKITHGLSDNMLTSLVLAARCPVFICPTMDGGMYDAPATRMNRVLAAELGFHIIEPESGYLASGLEDTGRLPEPEAIVQKLADFAGRENNQPLKGKRVTVTAGPTREYADTVRFISNPSSGKMGVAMAVAARQMGAEVTLVHGPLSVPVPAGMNAMPVTSAVDLFEAVKSRHKDTDIFIMAAAVSDFMPANRMDKKVKKKDASMQIELMPTPDSLKWLGENRRDEQVLIGFAMETENLIESAVQKRRDKRADFIIANTIGSGKTGFGGDENEVFLIGEDGEPARFSGSKTELALSVLEVVFSSNKRQ